MESLLAPQRFKIVKSTDSEESYASALSFNELEKDANKEREDVDEKELSILRNFIKPSLNYGTPRTFRNGNPCFSLQSNMVGNEEQKILSSTTSSKQLFEIGSSPTSNDVDMYLINSTYMKKLENVKDAIANGANVNTAVNRQCPLTIACEMGDTKLVEYLLNVPQINKDFQNIFGQTPLYIGIKNLFDEIVRLLLNYKAYVNIPDNMGKTPLHCALFQERPAMVKLLLAFGAKYEQPDRFGEAPMFTAAVNKPNLECLNILLNRGATPEYFNITGITLLSRAILNWTEFKIIKTLIQHGASVNTPDKYTGKTPLHFAAMINDRRVSEFLVNQGSNPNTKTIYNFTPYDEAIFHKSLQVAEYLVQITDDPNPKKLQDLKNLDIFTGNWHF